MELKVKLLKEPAGGCWDVNSVASVSEAVRKTTHCPRLLLQEATAATSMKKHFQDDTQEAEKSTESEQEGANPVFLSQTSGFPCSAPLNSVREGRVTSQKCGLQSPSSRVEFRMVDLKLQEQISILKNHQINKKTKSTEQWVMGPGFQTLTASMTSGKAYISGSL